MKQVVLTESQMAEIICEEYLSEKLVGLLSESRTESELKRKIRKALLLGMSVAAISAAIRHSDIPNVFKKKLIDDVEQQASVDTTGFAQKVKDVRAYMENALTNQGYSMKSTGLKPETLVSVSMKTGFDLPFLMAAAHQESCFGATPRARRTNSVYSVGSYDDGRNVVTYADPNDSVEDYVDLLNRRYLVDGKTIHDLMTPGKFVNDQGNRYASDKNYETKIKSIRNRIIKQFPDLGETKTL